MSTLKPRAIQAKSVKVGDVLRTTQGLRSVLLVRRGLNDTVIAVEDLAGTPVLRGDKVEFRTYLRFRRTAKVEVLRNNCRCGTCARCQASQAHAEERAVD